MRLSSSAVGLVIAAAHFSADKHRDQRRKGARNTPYINHPLEVAERLNRIGSIEDAAVLAAAILHDTIEDTETTQVELERLFGTDVAAIVAELTDDPMLLKDERKRLEIAHAPGLSTPARLIKLSDKTSNIADLATSPPGDWTLTRRREYVAFATRVVAGCRGLNAALDAEFDRVLADVRQHLR